MPTSVAEQRRKPPSVRFFPAGVALFLTFEDICLIFEDMSLVRGTSLSGLPELVQSLGCDADALLASVGISAADAGRHDVFVPLPPGGDGDRNRCLTYRDPRLRSPTG